MPAKSRNFHYLCSRQPLTTRYEKIHTHPAPAARRHPDALCPADRPERHFRLPQTRRLCPGPGQGLGHRVQNPGNPLQHYRKTDRKRGLCLCGSAGELRHRHPLRQADGDRQRHKPEQVRLQMFGLPKREQERLYAGHGIRHQQPGKYRIPDVACPAPPSGMG